MEGIVRGVLIAGEEKISRLKMTQSCLFETIIFLSIFNVPINSTAEQNINFGGGRIRAR